MDEIRVRLMHAWSFLIGVCVFYLVSEQLLEFLHKPTAPENRKLYFANLFENFLTHLKISGCGIRFSPFYFHQLWQFGPGLYPRESGRPVCFGHHFLHRRGLFAIRSFPSV